MTSLKPQVQCIFHDDTSTCTYVVKDPTSKHAMIIDPVMDFDPAAVRTSQKHNNAVVAYCQVEELQIDYIIYTHVHADHMTGADFLKQKFPMAKTAIGENVTKVQSLFKGIFNLDSKKDNFEPDGTQIDVLTRWERVSCGKSEGGSSIYPRSYSSLRVACCRRRCLHRRHSIHARYWNCSL